MDLKNETELASTQEKLAELQARYQRLQDDAAEDARVRRLTLLSLKRLINQLTEEIAVYKAHHAAAAG